MNKQKRPKGYNLRFKILFSLSLLLSSTLFMTSFMTGCFCISCVCNASQIESMTTMIKEFMMLTIVPAVLGLYISIRPLFLLKKTAFERKTKKHLMVIASLLLFNTLVTPVAAIATLTHREAVRRRLCMP